MTLKMIPLDPTSLIIEPPNKIKSTFLKKWWQIRFSIFLGLTTCIYIFAWSFGKDDIFFKRLSAVVGGWNSGMPTKIQKIIAYLIYEFWVFWIFVGIPLFHKSLIKICVCTERNFGYSWEWGIPIRWVNREITPYVVLYWFYFVIVIVYFIFWIRYFDYVTLFSLL